jgi:hypothetical protein
LGPIALVAWWVWPYASGLGQSLDSLTAVDVLLIVGCMVGLIGVAVPLALFVFNVDGADLDWEQWGRFGLGLIAVAASTALWLAWL